LFQPSPVDAPLSPSENARHMAELVRRLAGVKDVEKKADKERRTAA
jgi:hypothetical protein